MRRHTVSCMIRHCAMNDPHSCGATRSMAAACLQGMHTAQSSEPPACSMLGKTPSGKDALTVLRSTQPIAMMPMGRYQPPSENGPWQNSRPLKMRRRMGTPSAGSMLSQPTMQSAHRLLLTQHKETEYAIGDPSLQRLGTSASTVIAARLPATKLPASPSRGQFKPQPF